MSRVRRNRLAQLGALVTLSLTALGGAVSAQNAVAGNYTFDDTLTGTIGRPLTTTGTVTYVDDTIGGNAARVALFSRGSYFTVDHRMAPNGGGNFVNQYSIIMDIRVPSIPNGFVSLYQTNVANTNDGDWFIRGSDLGMGISGDYTDAFNGTRFALDTWQRIVLIIDTTTPTGSFDTKYASYVNGARQNVVQSPSGWGRDGRFSLATTFHIFADEDNETADIYINNFQVRNYAMSEAEIAALGGPTASALPVPGAILSGTLDLLDIDPGAGLQVINFTFRPNDMSGDFNLPIRVGADGEFQLNVPSKNYLVRAKGSNYLADVFSVDATSGSASGLSATLIPGDAEEDNSVDVLDLDALVLAFDATPTSPNWNGGVADFNHDGSVDVLDLDILINNFDAVGEELP